MIAFYLTIVVLSCIFLIAGGNAIDRDPKEVSKEWIEKNAFKLYKTDSDHFDKNFSRGGFFGKKWKPRKDGVATHLNNTGTLRRSIRSKVSGSSLTFTSSTPYSAIHNEGGTVVTKVTPKMKKYFWAMFKKTGLTKYKYMALVKPGSKIKIPIPQRQFLGEYPGLDKTIDRAAKRNIEAELKRMAKNFR